jgi:hypothetical protein
MILFLDFDGVLHEDPCFVDATARRLQAALLRGRFRRSAPIGATA